MKQMTIKILGITTAVALSGFNGLGVMAAGQEFTSRQQQRTQIENMQGRMGNPGRQTDQSGARMNQPGTQTGQFGQIGGNVTYATSPGTVTEGITTSSASSLTADASNATGIVMSDENNTVKIEEAGTYIVSGSCSEGSITVKKGTTGVVLILQDLSLSSSVSAPLSLNKGSEVKLIIDGTVTLTDNEDIANEESDDFDGAALKAKSGSSVYLTGNGTLNIIGNTKNGIKIGDAQDGEPAFVIDGPSVNISAANDGINSGYDLALLSGSITISAGDDGIHADRIVTVDGADITIKESTEAIEGTIVNLFNGSGSFTASDDAINAANSDGTYESLGYSVNVTGGTWTVSAGSDGIDSNGNVNIIGGTVNIQSSASNGGDSGIDYDGDLYVSDSASLSNSFGTSGPDNMMGGGMGGSFMGGNAGNAMTGGRQEQQGTPSGESGTFRGSQTGQDSFFGEAGSFQGRQMEPWQEMGSMQEPCQQFGQFGMQGGHFGMQEQPSMQEMPGRGFGENGMMPDEPEFFGQNGQIQGRQMQGNMFFEPR